MSLGPIKRYEYSVEDIIGSNGSACTNPKVTWEKVVEGVYINCPPGSKTVTVSFDESYSGPLQVHLFIECEGCFACEPVDRIIDFCTKREDCGPCETCGPNHVCVSRCPGACDPVRDICVDCGPDHPCLGDKVCSPDGCNCPINKPIDLGNNRCGQCRGAADCEALYGKCAQCIDNQCVPRECPGGACNPKNGDCVECNNAEDCASRGPNYCCSGGNKCVCCPGFVYDPISNGCVEKPCSDESCGPCGRCVGKRCVPITCPDGQVCVGDMGCVEKCDCNNPASCTDKGKICKNIDGNCVCVSCGDGCTSGCAEGCHCEGNNKCVVDKCHGSCENGGDCGPGCGCDPVTKKCVQCSLLGCAGEECNKVLGCECIGGNTCADTGNRCSGGCSSKTDCGKGCTCPPEIQKCTPCEYYSCEDCANHEGCKCNGSNCEDDPDYKCNDILEIVKIDASCDIEGHLTKENCCSCPVISSLFEITARTSSQPDTKLSGTHALSFKAQLFKGNNNDASSKLKNTSNPDIADNETALAGAYKLQIITTYLDHPNGTSYPSKTVNVFGSIVSKDEVLFSNVIIHQINGRPIGSGPAEIDLIVKDVTFVLSTEGWEFPNTCKYANKELGRVTATTNSGIDKVVVRNINSNSDCRDPLFTWFKSPNGVYTPNTRIRTVYVPVDLTTGKYIDRLPNDLEESCNDYMLKVDCSCQGAKSKRITFCKPSDITAVLKPNSCNKTVTITVPASCHANKDKQFELKINGSTVWSGKLYPTAPAEVTNKDYTVTSATGVTSVKLHMVCDTDKVCDIEKTFPPLSIPNVEPSSKCLDGTNIFYFFQKGMHNPDWTGVTFKTAAGLIVQPEGSLPDGYSNGVGFIGQSGVEYKYEVFFSSCGSYEGTQKKSCCDTYIPSFDVDCDNGVIKATNLQDGVTYQLDSYTVTKEKLGAANLTEAFVLASGSNIGIPKVLYWTTPGCPINSVNIPSSQCCPNTVFNVVQDGLDPAYIVDSIYPPAEGNIYYIKTNNGAFVPHVPGESVSAPVGNVTVVLKNKKCEQPANVLEVRSSCDVSVDVTQSNCKYKAVTSEGGCPCNKGAFIPEITSVEEITGNLLRVTFNGSFLLLEKELGAGALPLVKSGRVDVAYGSISNSMVYQTALFNDVDMFSGYVDIPCEAATHETVGFSFSYLIIGGSSPYYTMRFYPNWPTPHGVTITGLKVNNITAGQSALTGVLDIPGGGYFWEVEGIKLVPEANLQIKWQLSNGEEAEANLANINPDNAYGIELPVNYYMTKSGCACKDVAVHIRFLELNNGCTYGNNPVINYPGAIEVDSFSMADAGQICPNGTFVDPGWQALIPNVVNGRKTRVDWYENGTLIKSQFTDGGAANPVYLDGSLPANPDGIEFGKEYTAKASCGCTADDTAPLCLIPTISSAITTCDSGYYSDGSSVLKLKYSLTGCYANKSVNIYNSGGVLIDTYDTNGSGYIVDREVVLDENMAGLENDFYIYASFDTECNGVQKFVSRAEVNLAWTVDCTDSPISYDLVFDTGVTLELVSGTGTVNGNRIEDIPNDTVVEFRGVQSGCTSKIYSYSYDCTISPTPSPTPTPTRTPSKSVITTQSVTQTKTVTPSTSGIGGGGVIIYSGTPTPTPSKTPTPSTSVTPNLSATPTPTLTPSVSITTSNSGTPGASITVTPTQTKTPSVTPTQTKTPSITPTPSKSEVEASVTPTPSLTGTPSLTPTRTQSSSPCDGDCSAVPLYNGTLCSGSVFCCHGVAYNPAIGEQCCANQVINTNNGDVCCFYTAPS